MFLSTKLEPTNVFSEDGVALVQLEDEIFNLLQEARKTHQALNDLANGFFQDDEVEMTEATLQDYCMSYPDARLRFDIAIDHMSELLERLKLLDSLAEKYSKSNRKDGSDDE